MRVIKPYEPSAEEIRREWTGADFKRAVDTQAVEIQRITREAYEAERKFREKTRKTMFFFFVVFTFLSGVALANLVYLVMQ